MRISEIEKLIFGKIVTSQENEELSVEYAFASDLMSDVLTTSVDNLLLITGLSNLQTIRTAEMADIFCIVLVRGKSATIEMKSLADENGIVIIETDWSMFRASGILFGAGLIPVF